MKLLGLEIDGGLVILGKRYIHLIGSRLFRSAYRYPSGDNRDRLVADLFVTCELDVCPAIAARSIRFFRSDVDFGSSYIAKGRFSDFPMPSCGRPPDQIVNGR